MPKKGAAGRPLCDELIAIDQALDEFTNDMRARLHEKARQGYRGWDDPKCEAYIRHDLIRDADQTEATGDKLHLHDIANRAMMLWWQAWRLDNRCASTDNTPIVGQGE